MSGRFIAANGEAELRYFVAELWEPPEALTSPDSIFVAEEREFRSHKGAKDYMGRLARSGLRGQAIMQTGILRWYGQREVLAEIERLQAEGVRWR